MRSFFLSMMVANAMMAVEAPAVSSSPTGDEVTIYQRLNSHRADRMRGDERLRAELGRQQVTILSLAWTRSFFKPGNVPGLVFNPLLNQAAHEVMTAGAKPLVEQPNEVTGVLAKVGYKQTAETILLLAVDAASPQAAYDLAMAQIIGESSSPDKKATWPKYASPEIHRPGLREVGIAMSGGKDHWTLVMILGSGSAKRHAGGTVYSDTNHNGMYDLDEGVSGAQVTVAGTTMTTGPGGGWWASLPTTDEVEVSFAKDAAKSSIKLDKGDKNVIADWRMPLATDLKIADKLLVDCDKLPLAGDLDKRRKPLAALLVGTRCLALDSERQKRIETLVAPVMSEYLAAVSTMVSLLSEEPDVFRKKFAELNKLWAGAMPTWFKDADSLYKLKQQVLAVLAATAEHREKSLKPTLKLVEKAKETSVDPAFYDQLNNMQTQLESVEPIAPPTAKTKTGKK